MGGARGGGRGDPRGHPRHCHRTTHRQNVSNPKMLGRGGVCLKNYAQTLLRGINLKRLNCCGHFYFIFIFSFY